MDGHLSILKVNVRVFRIYKHNTRFHLTENMMQIWRMCLHQFNLVRNEIVSDLCLLKKLLRDELWRSCEGAYGQKGEAVSKPLRIKICVS